MLGVEEGKLAVREVPRQLVRGAKQLAEVVLKFQCLVICGRLTVDLDKFSEGAIQVVVLASSRPTAAFCSVHCAPCE